MNKHTTTGNQTMVHPNVLEASKADLFFGGVFDAVHDNIVNCNVEMVCVGHEEENNGSHDEDECGEYSDDSTTTNVTNSNSRSSDTTTMMTTTSTNMFDTLTEVDIVKVPTPMEDDKTRRREVTMRMTRPNMDEPIRYCPLPALAGIEKSGGASGSEEEDDDDSSAAEDDIGPVENICPLNATTDIKTTEVLGCELSDVDVLCGRRCADIQNHAGNKTFRGIIEQQKWRYRQSETKEEKRSVIQEVQRTIQNHGGRFMQEKLWFPFVAAGDKEELQSFEHKHSTPLGAVVVYVEVDSGVVYKKIQTNLWGHRKDNVKVNIETYQRGHRTPTMQKHRPSFKPTMTTTTQRKGTSKRGACKTKRKFEAKVKSNDQQTKINIKPAAQRTMTGGIPALCIEV